MKKIYFLVKNIYNMGGDTRAVVLLANKFARQKGYQVNILSLFKTEEHPSFELDKKIFIYNLFNEPFSIKKHYFSVMMKFKKFTNHHSIDLLIVEAMGFNSFTVPALIGNPNIKTISVEHASYFDGGKPFGLAWWGRKLSCLFNNCTVVLTQKDKEDYEMNYKKINRIEQIYNPLDSTIKRYEYNEDSQKIITCGRLVEVKGYFSLLEVAKIIFSYYPTWEWHIYGKGELEKDLKNRIIELDLENNVKIMGEKTNIYEVYKNYSFYVMTSKSESFGMVLLEALQSGIPVISFDCPNGPGEIIEDSINGYLIENFSIEKMAKKIMLFLESSELRKKMAHNTDHNLWKFKEEKIFKEWKELIDEVLNEKKDNYGKKY
ncbi:glycosyltransferase family 4 protein [Exiguobacterium sp. s142]|uniref:glycosyltransferase family 4 protein n=1 Tax=Exiguobacterium sp. s142 TaxID=2751222 RepID=UPI001BEC26D2|nr:glycosyltransferase family 4 protein [Exiguobacterium sp. s142]